MKNTVTILGAIIFASFMFASCGQTSNKQKELELKEREVALKEKEFALKEKGLLKADSLAKKTATVPNTNVTDSKENTEVKLVVNPQNEGGGFGQIGFSKNSKLLFWFDQKTQKGKIVINGTKYILNNCSNGENSYKLSGNEVIITAQNLENIGEGDCFHYKCPKVTITLNGVSTSINNIEIQDCLSFSW